MIPKNAFALANFLGLKKPKIYTHGWLPIMTTTKVICNANYFKRNATK